jgi:predicted N-acyltransferase
VTNGFSARLLGPASQMDAREWDALANPEEAPLPNPFTRHAFFSAVEESGSACAATGWQPLHLVLERAGTPAALLPLYLKNHSQGEYVFDRGWAEAFSRAGGRYYPKLQASVPFTPASGRRVLLARGEGMETAAALLSAAANTVEKTGASSLHITFMTEGEWQLADTLGFLRRTDQQFHWDNDGYSSFDGFLTALSSSKRKNLRKERASVADAGVTFDWLTGRDISDDAWDVFFSCYTKTANEHWNGAYLNRDFFRRAGVAMGEQILLIMAKLDGRYIAGALNFFDGATLYGRNWGCLTHVPFLHFETCYYQAIDFAIARGLKRVEAGAQGGHKLLRGYLPRPTYSAHYIAHEGLRRAVADYLERERQAVAEHIEELTELAPFRKA